MVSRFRYIIPFLLLVLSCAQSFAQVGHRPLRIGLIADIQYADKEDSRTRFYRSSVPKLDEAVQFLNNEQLAFTVVMGDLVDEGPKDLQPILSLLDRLKAPHHHILGNHDFPKVFEKDVFKKFQMPKEYYSIDKSDWKFIFLNTNDLASYAVEPGSAKEKEFLQLQSQLKLSGKKNIPSYNGGIGYKQLKWLEGELKKAKKRGKKVMVFSHHPFLPQNGLETLNTDILVDLFVKYTEVKAVISGHHHPGNFEMYQGVPFITLEGMVETKENAYGSMDIFEDRIIIYGKGRMTSRDLPLR